MSDDVHKFEYHIELIFRDFFIFFKFFGEIVSKDILYGERFP